MVNTTRPGDRLFFKPYRMAFVRIVKPYRLIIIGHYDHHTFTADRANYNGTGWTLKPAAYRAALAIGEPEHYFARHRGYCEVCLNPRLLYKTRHHGWACMDCIASNDLFMFEDW